MKARLSRAAGEMFASLHSRNLRLFLGGQLISQVGNWMTMVAVNLLVLKITGNGVAVGFMTACQYGPVLLFGPWAGLVADRMDKRRILFIVQSFAMVQSFALAALAFMDSQPLVPLYLVAVAGGFATTFDNPARRAFVTELVPESNLGNAVSLNSAMMTASRIFGPAVAGLLITTVGYGWCFFIDGASYVAVLGVLALIRRSEMRTIPVTPRSRGQVREGLQYVMREPELWIPLAMMAIIGTFTFNFAVVFPLFVERSLGGTVSDFTALFSIVSVGSLLGALWSARRPRTTVRHVTVAAAQFGIAMLIMAAAPSLAWALPLGLLVGVGSVMFLTSSTAIMQIHAAPGMRGRVLALQAMVFLGSTPIGGPILGTVCETWGPRAGLIVGAMAAFAAVAFGVLMSRRVLGQQHRGATPAGTSQRDDAELFSTC